MIKRIFADISKVEDQDDGTIRVWGVASAPVEDSDGEIITADAMKAAMADYMKFGAVREMHQPKAAGTALEANIDDDGVTTLCAHIVDPVAVKKVQTGVYKGFSIGGKVTARDDAAKTTITGLRWVETSLVDRPANPASVFTMYKADDLEKPTGEGGDPVAKVLILDNGDQFTKAQVVDALAKYEGSEINDAAQAIYALREINWLLQDEVWEAQQGEPEPPEQIAALRAAIAALKQFVISELQEDHSEPGPTGANIVSMSDGITDLSKAGAKFSAATKTALASVHKAAKECVEHLDKLAYQGDDDDADKIDTGDDLQKVADGEALAKIAKLEQERDDLQKRVAELEAMPAPPKGSLKTISKDEDSDLGKQQMVFVDANGQPLEGEALAKAQIAQIFKK